MASYRINYQLHSFLAVCFKDSCVPIRHLAYNEATFNFSLTGRITAAVTEIETVKERAFSALKKYYFITPQKYLRYFKGCLDALEQFKGGHNRKYLQEVNYVTTDNVEDPDNDLELMKGYIILNQFLEELGVI